MTERDWMGSWQTGATTKTYCIEHSPSMGNATTVPVLTGALDKGKFGWRLRCVADCGSFCVLLSVSTST